MAYARFSSDSFNSDVYVYADCYGGYTIHVAERRRENDEVPRPDIKPKTNDTDFDTWHRNYNEIMNWLHLDSTYFVDIDHEQAGSTHHVSDIHEVLHILLLLRKEGFHVPDRAIARLEEERDAQCSKQS